jgi:hypothetical protein
LIKELDVTPLKAMEPEISGLKRQLAREMQRINAVFSQKMEAVSIPIGNVDWADELYYEGMDIRQLPSRENAF